MAVVEELPERAPNLAGMKVSDAPFERVEPYIATGLDVFIGAESLIRPGLERGAAGAVSGIAAAFPEAVSALVAHPDAERARMVESLAATRSRAPRAHRELGRAEPAATTLATLDTCALLCQARARQ